MVRRVVYSPVTLLSPGDLLDTALRNGGDLRTALQDRKSEICATFTAQNNSRDKHQKDVF